MTMFGKGKGQESGPRCNAVVTANLTADIEGVPGYGMPYLVSCPLCVARSLHAATRSDEAWHGAGETYAATLDAARSLALQHNTTHRRMTHGTPP